MPGDDQSVQDLVWLAGGHGHELAHGGQGLLSCVERLGGIMFGVALQVGESRFFLLKMTAVGKNDLGQSLRALRAVDRTPEPDPGESRQVAAVVDVGVGQHDGIHRFRGHRERCPVLKAQVLDALEKTAVDENAAIRCVEESLASGDRAGPSQECQYG